MAKSCIALQSGSFVTRDAFRVSHGVQCIRLHVVTALQSQKVVPVTFYLKTQIFIFLNSDIVRMVHDPAANEYTYITCCY